jgi:DNA-binding MarR family transcriptional regulator
VPGAPIRIRLEDEIQQHVFDDEFLKATLNILVTADRISAETGSVLKPYGISNEQYNVLRILRGQHPNVSPLRLISERMISKSSNATRLVEKLRQKGFVSRTICESNRRQVEILITKAGLRLLDELDPIIRDSSNTMNNITKAESKELNRILDKIRS